MKKISQRSVSMGVYTGMFAAIALLISLAVSTPVYAYTTISSQLDLGESNRDVTNLQTFFADNSSIYPEGLVTGYFGSLTRASVLRFQAAYGLDQAGRVGPMTRDRINVLINNGGWTTSDMAGPSIYAVAKSMGSNSATLNWNTDELASAKVFYGTSPVMMNEGDINSAGFGSISGFVANNDNIARQAQ